MCDCICYSLFPFVIYVSFLSSAMTLCLSFWLGLCFHFVFLVAYTVLFRLLFLLPINPTLFHLTFLFQHPLNPIAQARGICQMRCYASFTSSQTPPPPPTRGTAAPRFRRSTFSSSQSRQVAPTSWDLSDLQTSLCPTQHHHKKST